MAATSFFDFLCIALIGNSSHELTGLMLLLLGANPLRVMWSGVQARAVHDTRVENRRICCFVVCPHAIACYMDAKFDTAEGLSMRCRHQAAVNVCTSKHTCTHEHMYVRSYACVWVYVRIYV